MSNASNPTIREANTSDASALLQLLNQLEHPLSEAAVHNKIIQYKVPFYHLLVVEIEQQVVGFAALHGYDVFYDVGLIGRITAFCIDKEFRSQGIGQKLLQSAESFFIDQGCIRIEVSSNERRTGAHSFYLQNGFIINSKRFIKQLVK